jgi:hypothetical protein
LKTAAAFAANPMDLGCSRTYFKTISNQNGAQILGFQLKNYKIISALLHILVSTGASCGGSATPTTKSLKFSQMRVSRDEKWIWLTQPVMVPFWN